MSKQARVLRQPSAAEAVSLLVVIALVFFGGIISGMDIIPLMVIIAGYSVYIAISCGYTWRDIEYAAGHKIGYAVPALSIFLAVGMVTAALIYSGTIPMLIYYGIRFISARWMYLCAFLLSALFSLLTGTSNGTVSTVGLILMSMGAVMPRISPAMLGGAIISGSVLGDKLSPLSDTSVLAASLTENSVYSHIRYQFRTVLPAAGLTLLLYLLIGLFSSGEASVSEETELLQASLASVFRWSWLLLIPIAFMLYGMVSGQSPVLVLVSTALMAVVIGSVVQKFPLAEGIRALYSGFSTDILTACRPEADIGALRESALSVLNRGGVTAMTRSFITVFICYFFCASAELSGALEILLGLIGRFIRSTFSLTLAVGVSTMGVIMACGASAPAFSIVTAMFRRKYEEEGLDSLNLSRTVEDFGTGFSSFIPWSSSGMLYAGILGLTNLSIFLHTWFIQLVWVFSLVYAFTGFSLKRTDCSE